MKNYNIGSFTKARVKRSEMIALFSDAHNKWEIEGVERFKSDQFVNFDNAPKLNSSQKALKPAVTMEFALKINALLPLQPWKPGIHNEILSKLECTKSEYFDAVKILIEEGLRFKQKDGVVYDDAGNVISFDPDRVDTETLKLKD
jgi:hypothetical protein